MEKYVAIAIDSHDYCFRIYISVYSINIMCGCWKHIFVNGFSLMFIGMCIYIEYCAVIIIFFIILFLLYTQPTYLIHTIW